jgi:hypothetical protein
MPGGTVDGPPRLPALVGGDTTLREYFEGNPGRLIHKWVHYFEIYERHLGRYRGTDATILEIGVFHGGSLQMWRHYFGDRARIVGVDIDERCRAFAEPGIEVVIGDQADRAFLRTLRERVPQVDVLIDDGGHTMVQQIATFEELFPHVASDGVYLCEDLHTSYWAAYGGRPRRGLRRHWFRGPSFVDYSKRLIDELNAWHWRAPGERAGDFTRSAYSMHFYDSVLVVEKRPVEPPERRMTGTPAYPDPRVEP